MEMLVTGAGGTLGRCVCDELAARGHRAITLGRRDVREPAVLARAGAPVIIACAGASVAMALGHGWRGYGAVDVPLGIAAAAAARATRARLVYVGVHHPAALRRGAYVAAHERVADAMRDVDGCVVRATGFYAAFAALRSMARHGFLLDVGDGRARTNPIAEVDLAKIVVDAALGDAREVAAGGPDVMTRREIFEQIAAIEDRRVRIIGVPVWAARCGAAMLRVVHPRIGQFAQFAAGLARNDVIAPQVGTTRLAEYLRDSTGLVAAGP